MNAGQKKTSVSGRLRMAALATVVCSGLLGAAEAQAREPFQFGSGGGISTVGQRYGGQQQSRRRGRGNQGNYTPSQTYIVQKPVTPYLVPQPVGQAPYAFYDVTLGIRGIAVPGFGVQVLSVRAFGLGYNLGLEPGDVIVQINGRPVQSAYGISQALLGWQGQFKLVVLDVRTGSYQSRWGQLYPY